MKLITQLPESYDHINNFELRARLEDDKDEPIMFTNLKACGYVGNRPNCCENEEHEDDTWAIEQYCEDGKDLYETFLYTSKFEYEQDCEILGLPMEKTFRVWATVETSCYLDVEANSKEEAIEKAEKEDGGTFISDEGSGAWNINYADEL